jgi:hypothetical protein
MKWVPFGLVVSIGLLSAVAYPVYDRFTGLSVAAEIVRRDGTSAEYAVPRRVFAPGSLLTRIPARGAVAVLQRRIARYMTGIDPGDCAFRWTVRYSPDSLALDSAEVFRFSRKRCP